MEYPYLIRQMSIYLYLQMHVISQHLKSGFFYNSNKIFDDDGRLLVNLQKCCTLSSQNFIYVNLLISIFTNKPNYLINLL